MFGTSAMYWYCCSTCMMYVSMEFLQQFLCVWLHPPHHQSQVRAGCLAARWPVTMEPDSKFYNIQFLKMLFFCSGKGAVKVPCLKRRIAKTMLHTKVARKVYLLEMRLAKLCHCKGAAKVPYEKSSLLPVQPL